MDYVQQNIQLLLQIFLTDVIYLIKSSIVLQDKIHHNHNFAKIDQKIHLVWYLASNIDNYIVPRNL